MRARQRDHAVLLALLWLVVALLLVELARRKVIGFPWVAGMAGPGG